MSKPARPARPGIAFVTLTTCDRRPVFEIARIAELFVDTLLHYRTVGHYKLHAYVVMPDHVHLLLTPQGMTLDQAVELIKHGFAYRLDSQLPVWQNGFTGYSVANLRDLEIVRAFTHQIPVRAHLATAAELYRFSSAYRQNFAPPTFTAIPGGRSGQNLLGTQPVENQQDPPKLHIASATPSHKRAS
jgi:putative transposase